jgi:hypothetical protein
VSGPAQIPGERPLVVLDVDEVLALFFQGFGRFLAQGGYELRLERFALFSNIFVPGATQHLEVTAGRALFDEFFRTGADLMEPAPGAAEALASLSQTAEVTIRRPAAGIAQLDGEPVTLPEELHARVKPQSLRLLVPDTATTF